MLMVKTYLKESTIPEAGLGLFAGQDIKKGTITWKFFRGFDQKLELKIRDSLSDAAKAQFDTYTYNRVRGNESYHVLCGDNERFINHSDTPNILEGDILEEGENVSVAIRDIKKGEELFCNYYEFDANADKKLGRETKEKESKSVVSSFLNIFSKQK